MGKGSGQDARATLSDAFGSETVKFVESVSDDSAAEFTDLAAVAVFVELVAVALQTRGRDPGAP